MAKPKIGILIGSLRKQSFSRQIANILGNMLRDRAEVCTIEIGALQMFDQDFDDEGKTPVEWQQFREEIGKTDAFLFVTPEYNRSVPAVLKNALDVASRPYGQSRWDGKPGAVISVSPGQFGGFGANHHLRQTLMFLNIYTMQQPEAYLSDVASLLCEDGSLKSESAEKFLQGFADSFLQWIETTQK